MRIPRLLKIGAACIALILVYTATRLPREIEASIVWDRGQAAWDAKNYAEAERDYAATLGYFPQSTSVLGRLARAAQASGDKDKFNQVMDRLAHLARTDPEAAREMVDVLTEDPPRKP